MCCDCGKPLKEGVCEVRDGDGIVIEGNYSLYCLLTGKRELFSGLKLVIEVREKEYVSEARNFYEADYETLLKTAVHLLSKDNLTLSGEGLYREFHSSPNA